MKVWTALLFVAVFLMGALAVNADPGLNACFGEHIDNEISKCLMKAGYIDSWSRNLRNSGKLAMEKARFLSEYKDDLIKEMTRQNVGTKPHQMDVFLNRSFIGSSQAQGAGLPGSE